LLDIDHDICVKKDKNWGGNCNLLGDITTPTLVIVATDDLVTSAANSVSIVQDIPEAWLFQIKDADWTNVPLPGDI